MTIGMMIAAYILVGALVAGTALGVAEVGMEDVNVPKLIVFLLLWPLLVLVTIVAKVVSALKS